MPVPRPAFGPFEDRRNQIERVEQLAGGVFKVSYHLHVYMAGETTVDVNFPVAFSEMPYCTHGGSLAAGSIIDAGNFPMCSAMATNWVTSVRGGATYFTGCTVVLVLTGNATQEAFIDFSVEGKALQAPLPPG